MTHSIGLQRRKSLSMLAQASFARTFSRALAHATATFCTVNAVAGDPSAASTTVNASSAVGARVNLIRLLFSNDRRFNRIERVAAKTAWLVE